jgi:hypothetical protein
MWVKVGSVEAETPEVMLLSLQLPAMLILEAAVAELHLEHNPAQF